jgi:hypothetical protein
MEKVKAFVKNNRVLLLKLMGNLIALLVALGYISAEEGQQISDTAVMALPVVYALGGIVLGFVQRQNAYGPETVKKIKKQQHGH